MLERTHQVQKLEQEIKDLDSKISDKQVFLNEVRKNPEVRDREIRRQLNKVKPGETIIYLEEKPEPQP